MSAPRLEIDLDKIQHNARSLVGRLAGVGIAVTGVTKATLGSPAVAAAMVRGGVRGLGESRIENIEALRRGGVEVPTTLIRSPMVSQAARVVAGATASMGTELDAIGALSEAARARGLVHRILLMVELGDLREGILPGDLEPFVRRVLRLPGIALQGIGTNLACHSGVVPGHANMTELSDLATSIEADCGVRLEVVSGGNSANLAWALGAGDKGRVNDLRLGEAILLGRETLQREPVQGLLTDAFILVAEVIESKLKPSRAWGEIAQAAFGDLTLAPDRGELVRTILAVGRQDTDAAGLTPPIGIEILGASSDHLILGTGRRRLAVGSEVRFQVNYSALLRGMTSPFVAKVMRKRAAVVPA
ncbi:alanine/ornithine racemase family PLP-dependent enzyme [Engelhardtia mirabilis]|uniref:Alanine racemase n=1 Tax=Engelhardtia mirabilis TaxID=2528011 RepID=A0A518BLS4_9BACT|nr:alanine racemase [Planctomycetes bacterium Pla133]QDV02251.1 alanine racemase [Planctomycetes bacterium Pla86]